MRPRHVSYFGILALRSGYLPEREYLSKLDDDPTEQTENADNIINTVLRRNNGQTVAMRQFELTLSSTACIFA